jgi:hypothetical protein
MTTRQTVKGKYVLAAALAVALFFSVGVMIIAVMTQRPATPPPMPRTDLPAITAPTR